MASSQLQRLSTRLMRLARVDQLLPAVGVAWRALMHPHTPAPELALAGGPPLPLSVPSGLPWFGGLLLMAAPKKRTSYTKKRVRQAGQLAQRGPKLKQHLHMCPVCERLRAPHLVCEREDCKTYFRHRWL